jgi:hypothetical protein
MRPDLKWRGLDLGRDGADPTKESRVFIYFIARLESRRARRVRPTHFVWESAACQL